VWELTADQRSAPIAWPVAPSVAMMNRAIVKCQRRAARSAHACLVRRVLTEASDLV
jgi:hypothetical protein